MSEEKFPMVSKIVKESKFPYVDGANEMRQLLACHKALEGLVKSALARKPFSSPEMIKLFEKAEAALEGKL